MEFFSVGSSFDSAQVLAESHQGAGDQALQRLIARPEESWPLSPTGVRQQRLISVQAGGRCAKVEAELLNRQAPFVSPTGKSLVFFDVRINADGSYVAIEPLYSDLPAHIGDAARFLRENLVLLPSKSTSEQAGPLQAFVGLTIGPSGRVGYLIASAKELL